ncbi:2-C-methyl-D-erythritol 4-phosphate cytidylyltransferase [Actimicrobium sp. CCC2.4]|uniref:2-C-methyl-D-erythritol 4-phosphate cytidylyltransferase n=1 Tax=Actimicrobium sp. CCC2.4 TaxID=3048606 RepID=UPI002AC986E9|nr:2-C-methyl-D-erythritol 4-phosphate cytidylyltransferase [Actimicrobium sp. CCC2.4]MEB0136443.1 2-C-methyl-D-erythritol 4-phosphate cytidylyltransferase [Actimicrobium sp. CCC2.4]WPX34171.1 2-C-methyl-D-erythritol 4-phosphate cytidylyltransferase [Actimicrobium sp. CCC2.4]
MITVRTSPCFSSRYFALIPAAGIGARMGGTCPKQYLQLGALPMLRHVLDTFAGAAVIAHTYLVVSPDDGYIDALLADAPHLYDRVTLLRAGGATRQQSVLNGLQLVPADAQDWVLVHDAARPGLTGAMIDQLIAAVGEDAVGGLLALPVADTLKRSDGERVGQTVARSGLWAAQTPQMFRHELLKTALTLAQDVTDEASAIEALGLQPLLVPGSTRNFKVTLAEDAALATLILNGTP